MLPNKQVIDGYVKYGGVPHLDGGYTVFGEVLEGMDVVDKSRMWPQTRVITTALLKILLS